MSDKEYYFREPTEADILFLVEHMREDDRREIKRWSGASIEEEVRASVKNCDIVLSGVFSSGELACIFGASRVNIMDNTGCIWELSTTAVDKHPITFAKASKVGLNKIMESLSDVAEFENWVDKDYEKAVKWIGWMGGDFALNKKLQGRFGGEFLNFYIPNPYYKED